MGFHFSHFLELRKITVLECEERLLNTKAAEIRKRGIDAKGKFLLAASFLDWMIRAISGTSMR